MMNFRKYENIPYYDELFQLLPEHNRIDHTYKPTEKYWKWKGNHIHLDFYSNPLSKAKVILLHGVGGNGRILSFFGVPLAKRGFEVIAPDLPGYGLSLVQEGKVLYKDWIDLVNDLVNEELAKDNRPVFLAGLSAGGMLAYQAACINKKIAGLIVTNILDQRVQEVRDGLAINKTLNRVGLPFLKLMAKLNINPKIPIKLLVNMKAIVNNDQYLKILLKDKLASGASVPLKFIISLIEAQPQIEPEQFNLCPLLLIHPGEDKWTPLELSLIFYNRLNNQKEIKMLDNAGHFPVEEPGIGQLEEYTVKFISAHLGNVK